MDLISISATNPCHLYDLARALQDECGLARFYSGYPRWRLQPPDSFPLVGRSWRTLVTYGSLRLPRQLRPTPHRLFRWQDAGFDLAVARSLGGDRARWIHAMPGQALATFRAARGRGMRTVLNHASGPVRQQIALVHDEYRRAGVPLAASHGFDDSYFAREEEEYALADRHCAASSVVARQLESAGVPPERIWVVPYGADPARFHLPAASGGRDTLRVVYAGQLTLRKGLRVAFDALREVRRTQPVTFDLYGPVSADIASTLAGAQGESWVRIHGAVSQDALADAFRRATLLVLPSWEEAFGLVVVQALSCGLPCIVSDRVGAGDLIEHRRNGSIFPVGDAQALASEVDWWLQHHDACVPSSYDWRAPARRLLELSSSS